MRSFANISLLLVAALLCACKTQAPTAERTPMAGTLERGNRQSELQPGPAEPMQSVKNPDEGNEDYLAEGKRLYNQMNCSGCHAGGGGAIGPPLMDDEWIYGSSASNIYWTVMEGRPQGMPAFGGRVADSQVRQIAAYVRSLSGLNKTEPEQAAPQEEDPVTRGRYVFLHGPCVTCHTIQGTQAFGRVGPELTGLANRKTIAGGTIPNTKGHLAGWITNPQNLKPGTQMPPTQLTARDLHALLAYLETLK